LSRPSEGVSTSSTRVQLVVLGEAEVDAAVAGVEPARRDGLLPGVERDTGLSVRLRVAERRILPTAERVVRDRYRDGHVDADHAGLDLVLEATPRPAVVREDGGAVSVLATVHQGNTLFEG